jgi:hypothetical protein
MITLFAVVMLAMLTAAATFKHHRRFSLFLVMFGIVVALVPVAIIAVIVLFDP